MKIGILTFYCSDNYGAMLQAFGLKHCVKEIFPETEIIPYTPAYLAGRHWLLPYCPLGSPRESLFLAATSLKQNLRMGRSFFHQKKNMNAFRRKYLVQKRREIHTIRGLQKTAYDIYIVGSDQIWNPDITLGLRREYFGAFPCRCKKHVVAYAASLGGACLAPRYREDMRALLKSVDSISLREMEAAPYIRSLTEKEISVVSDPVFFLNAGQWEQLETAPKEKNYILLYGTECNESMRRYAERLSEEKALQIVELSLRETRGEAGFTVRTDAGPAEFLGFVHHASCVVTNSFHAAAFCIIFQKPFLVFAHSCRNARLSDLLSACGLKDRLVSHGQTPPDIDRPICWHEAEAKKNLMSERSRCFLRQALAGSNHGSDG